MTERCDPYTLLADAYDDIVGRDFFALLRGMFERIVARHRIAFSSAADLGCGTGLFARYLNALWRVPVFAVDRSPSMLHRAARNCRGARVTLLRQDIRRLLLPRPVDLVTANFDTVNHLLQDGDLPALFRRVHRHLRPGGHFIFDFITPCDPPAGTVHYRASSQGERDVAQRIRWIPARRLLLYDIVFRDPARGPPRVEFHRERAYAPSEVAAWLADAGFVVREVLDANTLARAARCPTRAIVVAQRR
ncbi:MAG TPA: class I SAM-dependent methyltransferase [Casimicrobiaceae bacterium]|nr:class I SAM-dependent methyltransferase [Casimicrobiaceae bacterium]